MYCEIYGSFKLGNHVGSMSVLLGVERANQKGKCPRTGLHAMKCGLKYNWEVNKRPLIVIIQHAFSAWLCSRSPEPIYSPSLPLSPQGSQQLVILSSNISYSGRVSSTQRGWIRALTSHALETSISFLEGLNTVSIICSKPVLPLTANCLNAGKRPTFSNPSLGVTARNA